MLRYLSPDAASQPSCVACHNHYERTPEIVARRIANRVPTGKQWTQGQLLGALSITIPLDRLEGIAAEQVRETSFLIFGILFAGTILTIWFSRRLAKQEVSLQEVERELRRSEKAAQDAKELLNGRNGYCFFKPEMA